MEGHDDGVHTRRQLPPALILHVLKLLLPNEQALSGRFTCRDARNGLSDPQQCTATLSQPLPPHAAPWDQAAWQQHIREHPYLQKL